MTTISTALTVTDTVGDSGTVRWDRDSQDLRDAGIAADEPTDALEALLGITIKPADDDDEDVDL